MCLCKLKNLYLMELLLEFASLVLKPILLAKISCQFCARSFSIIVQTWFEVLRFALCLHLIVLRRLVVFAFAVLSFPFRAYSALSRETLLETQIYRLGKMLENLQWDRNELEEKLEAAIRERKMMETMLMELEEEHDEAIAKAETLDKEVQVLKVEIQRLKEVHGKSLSSRGKALETDEISRKPNPNNTKKRSKYPHTDEIHSTGSKSYGLSLQPHATRTISNDREVALSRTLFSAVLLITVGIVMWGSESPCMPLVVALFTVVAMSLKSVIRLYTRIQHGPRSEAAVLLSFNWFMIGTLSYPMLPGVVHSLAPLTLGFVK